jgi:hypothetical protein
MFHAEPAGIRSWSSEPVVIRSRRLAAAEITSIAIIYKIMTIMINMHMPAPMIVLHMYESYWYSLTAAFWPTLDPL